MDEEDEDSEADNEDEDDLDEDEEEQEGDAAEWDDEDEDENEEAGMDESDDLKHTKQSSGKVNKPSSKTQSGQAARTGKATTPGSRYVLSDYF